jgi:hypothetical protein
LGENHALMSGNGCLHILLMFTCIWLNSWWSFHLGEADIFTASTGKITNRNGGDFSRDLIWPMLIRESWHYSVCIYIYYSENMVSWHFSWHKKWKHGLFNSVSKVMHVSL